MPLKDTKDITSAVIVPYDTLSEAALQGLAEAFVLREGTDYGAQPYTLAQKVAHVRSQLKRGDVVITFDPSSESVDIVVKRQAPAG